MKKLFFMFVMVFAISVTANANETIIDPSEDFSIENVVHTDFSQESQATAIAVTVASVGCFQYYYDIFFGYRIKEWGYGNVAMATMLAWEQAHSLCYNLREANLGTDFNDTSTWYN